MKTVFNLFVLAVLLVVAPSPCFALWDVLNVSKEQAKELGLEVRSTGTGRYVRVELEFPAEGALKHFTEVELNVGQENNLALAAPLREDRSKPGRVAVRFNTDTAQLDKLSLRVTVPYRDGGLGGAIYILAVKDFVELKKSR